MHIFWHGHSCFKIQEKIGNETVTIATDPFDKSIGLKVPRFEADILTISHEHHDHDNIEAIKGSPFIIRSAGEYDIKGVQIDGIEAYHDEKQGDEKGVNIIFRFEIEGVSIAHLGDIAHILDDKQLEKLSSPDILFIPVGGGGFTLDSKKAVELISRVEPRVVIPMHYKLPGMSLNIDGVEKFIKELGVKPRTEDKLKITKKELPQDEMELIILNIA